MEFGEDFAEDDLFGGGVVIDTGMATVKVCGVRKRVSVLHSFLYRLEWLEMMLPGQSFLHSWGGQDTRSVACQADSLKCHTPQFLCILPLSHRV